MRDEVKFICSTSRVSLRWSWKDSTHHIMAQPYTIVDVTTLTNTSRNIGFGTGSNIPGVYTTLLGIISNRLTSSLQFVVNESFNNTNISCNNQHTLVILYGKMS